MRTYDQIIFDELAAGRPVMLEDAGCLAIATKPAQITGKNTVSAPRQVVNYTSDALPEAKNAISILESEGVDYQQARDQYFAWLAHARREDGLVIEGVGLLKDGLFTPSTELDKALNPNAQQAVVVKKGGKTWLWGVIVIILLLILFFFLRSCLSMKVEEKEIVTVETVQQPQPPVEAAPDSTLAPAPEPTIADNAQNSGNGLNYPLAGRYYVVAGVFDYPENADKQISKLSKQFPDMTFEKFDYPGIRPGRTMVTIYSSAKYNETLSKRRELAWSYDLHDYWIYPPVN